MIGGSKPVSEADENTQMTRAEALAFAVESFGQTGAPDAETALARAQTFFEWIVRRSEPAAVRPIRGAP